MEFDTFGGYLQDSGEFPDVLLYSALYRNYGRMILTKTQAVINV